MEKEQMNKKMKLIITVLILMILFVTCGIFIKSTTTTRENKIISYLEEKYGTEFEIVELTYSGEKILFAELSCDGETCFPEIRDKNTIMYEYKIKSISDDIVFELEYEDGKLSDNIKSLYFMEKYSGDLVEDIGNYIINLIGDENSVLEVYPLEIKIDRSYEAEGRVYIHINQELNKVLDKDYVEKVEKIPDYIREKVKDEKNIKLSINIDYTDEMRIWFNESNHSEVLYDLSNGGYPPLEYDLTEYLKGLNK